MYHQRLSGDRITTPEFAQRLAAISTDIAQPVCAYINRRGQVIRVGVGTPRQTQIPPLELPRYGAERLSGLRYDVNPHSQRTDGLVSTIGTEMYLARRTSC